MKYRREIDGLRALAVVPVILFHAGFEAFSGSFVAVDVFLSSAARHRKVLSEVIKDKEISYIVWIGAFANITNGHDDDYLINGVAANLESAQNSVIQTLITLKASNKKVFFVGDTLRFPYHTANFRLKNLIISGMNKDAGIQKISRIHTIASLNESELLQKASEHSTLINAIDIFCKSQCSSANSEGNLLFVDRSHLSHRGSELLANAISAEMFNMATISK